MLVDAGLGPDRQDLPDGMGLTGGRLLDGLRDAGVSPGEVTDVVCTHLHSDHVGWLFDREGRETFTDATLWYGGPDWDHFVHGPGVLADHIRHGLSELPRHRHAPVDAEVEVAPGVTAVPVPGHTPGHLGVRIDDGATRRWLVGDAITHPVQLIEPTWHSFGDVEPRRAHETREWLWQELRRPGTSATGSHFPGLRFGEVRGAPPRAVWLDAP